MWICPPDTRGPAATAGAELWAPETLAAVLAAFTAPLHRVGVLPWPDPAGRAPIGPSTPPERGVAVAEIQHRPGPASALGVIGAAGRIPILLDLHAGTGPGAATVLSTSTEAAVRAAEPRSQRAQTTHHRSSDAGIGDHKVGSATRPQRLDLIITGAKPGQVSQDVVQQVALGAARCLRLGGTLVVLTHCDHIGGRLVDPGGLLVTAAQNADLLHLQHIVVLSTLEPDSCPVQDERSGDRGAETDEASAGEEVGCAWPVPHRRAHIDLYVFGQPHDHAVDDEPDAENDAGRVEVGSGLAATGELR